MLPSRQLLQSKRDEINKEMRDYMTEFSKFNSLTTKSINEGKAEHQNLNIKVTYSKELGKLVFTSKPCYLVPQN